MMTGSFVDTIISSNGYTKTQIIQVLNEIQAHFGYLPMSELEMLGNRLNITKSKLWGIISFYNHYRLTKPAKYNLRVCFGTACHVKNSEMLKENFEDRVIEDNLTDVSTESVYCLGSCAKAPVFELNKEIHGSMTTEKVARLVNQIKVMEEAE